MKTFLALCAALVFSNAVIADDDVDRLVGAMLGETPIINDLQSLTDEVGGRVTGSPANEAAIEWALARFLQSEVPATKEAFEMPYQWQERGVSASISGDFWIYATGCRQTILHRGRRIEGPARRWRYGRPGRFPETRRIGKRRVDTCWNTRTQR